MLPNGGKARPTAGAGKSADTAAQKSGTLRDWFDPSRNGKGGIKLI